MRQPPLTSILIPMSGPTASRTAATRTSPLMSRASPTLSLTVRKPAATNWVASMAIASGDFRLMTREMDKASLARPPRSAQTGRPAT